MSAKFPKPLKLVMASQPTLCNLEVVLMPNGEIICLGKTVGWFRELGKYLKVKKVKEMK